MKLVGDLKEKVEKAENQEEAQEIIKDAGMELTVEEMKQVAGGLDLSGFHDRFGKDRIEFASTF